MDSGAKIRSRSLIGIVLAAGKGSRFRSNASKVLTTYRGTELIRIVVEAMYPIVERIIVVVGPDSDRVRQVLRDYPGIAFVLQPEPLGTGHALMMVEDVLEDPTGELLISYADKPRVSGHTFRKLVQAHRTNGHLITFTTAFLDDPGRKGRIVRNNGVFQGVVEYRDASEEVRKLKEVNGGFICARSAELFERLKRLNRDNAAGEYYLTGVFQEYLRDGCQVGTVEVDGYETIDINTWKQLKSLNRSSKLPV